MPTFASTLMSEAKRVAKLSRRACELRRQLKLTQAELRLAKKLLKATAAAREDPFNQSAPMRLFEEV